MGDGSHGDVFGHKDKPFLEFLDEVERHAQALVILGDALDFDQAWYFSRIVRAHGEVISRLTRLTDQMRVIYVYGNHDPDILLFRDILKWQLCDKVVIDGHILAVHGYEFDTYVGEKFEETSVMTKAMHMYERIFRTWIRIPLRDYYTLSNRLVHVLFFWLRRGVDLLQWVGPKVNRPDWGRGLRAWTDFWVRGAMGDPMGITLPAIEALRSGEGGYDTIICGHSHLPGVVPIDNGTLRYVNLGSWSFGNSQYGVWDGTTFHLRDWITGREVRDEQYVPIFQGLADRTYEDWFQDHYMGYLRFRCGEEGRREGVRPPPWPVAGAVPRPELHTERIDTEADVPAPTG
jgi:UDP-2,3-diacylglucosamine pyrophosphatase LpxH